MKIETRDAARPVSQLHQPQHLHPGLMMRAALTIALAACLIVALHWALNTTNANARQLSSNLTQLQDRLDKPSEAAPPLSRTYGASSDDHTNHFGDGPTLEPADSRQ